jgi:hypothetical protein
MRTTKIEPATVVQRMEDISVTDTGEGLFLMDVTTGYLFKLNQTATSVWESLAEPISVVDLCARLAAEYGMRNSECLADVSELLESLQQGGLIKVGNG